MRAIARGLLLAGLAMAALPRAAGAAPTAEQVAEASRAFAEGERAFAAGDWPGAAQAFERANRLAPHPDNLWNAARAWEKAGQDAPAANDYAAYLRIAPADAKDRDVATRQLGDLAKRLGRLEVVAPGARDLTLDGKPAEEGVVYVVPGEHVLACAFASGPASRVVEVAAGASFSAAMVARAPQESAPAAPPQVDKPAPPAAAPKPVDDRGVRVAPPALVWIGAGLTVASGALLTISGVDTINAKSDYDAAQDAQKATLLSQGQAKESRTNALIGVTAGLGALTAVAAIWFVDWRGKRASARVDATGAERGNRVVTDELPRLGAYETLLELASGGMGTVYLARHDGAAGFARLVVIKRVHRHLLKSRDFHDMFRDEARLASQIRHPNVVPVDNVVEAEGELFSVQPYVESITLADLLDGAAREKVRLPPHVVARVLGDALAGLEGAHDAADLYGRPLEIVHRDVSPQNVLVGRDGRSRIIDFGIAKAARRATVTSSGVLKGKLAYMAPEQLRRQDVDRRVDVFAAGVVLYEALVGKRPFECESEGDTLLAILVAEPPPPSTEVPGLCAEIDAVVERALARERDERYATAAEMAEAIERAIAPAQPREVAAWVERAAGDVLDARRARVAVALDEPPRLRSGVVPAAPDTARPGARGATAADANRAAPPAAEGERGGAERALSAPTTDVVALPLSRSPRATLAAVAVALVAAAAVALSLRGGAGAAATRVRPADVAPPASGASTSAEGAAPTAAPVDAVPIGEAPAADVPLQTSAPRLGASAAPVAARRDHAHAQAAPRPSAKPAAPLDLHKSPYAAP